MGKVVMYGSVSVDGFIADEKDQPGPLFDWLTSGDVPLDESGASRNSKPHARQRPQLPPVAVLSSTGSAPACASLCPT